MPRIAPLAAGTDDKPPKSTYMKKEEELRLFPTLVKESNDEIVSQAPTERKQWWREASVPQPPVSSVDD